MEASAALAAAASSDEIQKIAVETLLAMLPSARGVRATLFPGTAPG
jgi:hypothetical protein